MFCKPRSTAPEQSCSKEIIEFNQVRILPTYIKKKWVKVVGGECKIGIHMIMESKLDKWAGGWGDEQ